MTSFLLVWALTTVTPVSRDRRVPDRARRARRRDRLLAADRRALARGARPRRTRATRRSCGRWRPPGGPSCFSGTTVAIGLLALVALPVPFLRSVGYGGMLIPLVSVAVATTLLPVVLSTLGPRLDWPHLRTDDRASRAWTRWAQLVVRRRWLAAGRGGRGARRRSSCAAHRSQLGPPTAARTRSASAATPSRGSTRSSGRASERACSRRSRSSRRRATRAAAGAGAAPASTGVQGATAPAGPRWHRGGSALVDVRRAHRRAPRRSTASATAAHDVGPRRPRRRHRRPEQRLRLCRVRQLPADGRADRAADVRAAGAGVPLAAAAAEGGRC